MIAKKKKFKILLDNWREEKESALLYHEVSRFERDERRKEIFHKLGHIEEEHARLWEEALKRYDAHPDFKPRLKVKVLIFLIKLFGQTALIDILERNEYAKIRGYFKQLELFSSDKVQDDIKKLFAVEKSHVAVLNSLRGKPRSPFHGSGWHKGGGSIRDIIFGMNDGLLSIFSLIAGLAGGSVAGAMVLLAGLAGTVAGAISMAAGAFVSTRAEREVMEQQLAIERKELELMPEGELKELAHVYQLKGIPRPQAEEIAHTIMSDKEVALETMAREELGFAPRDIVNPFKAAFLSGISFIVGAAIPIVPFVFLDDKSAFPTAIVCSFSSFFIIGAVRTIVTGKKMWRSGLEMFIIGVVAALVTYQIGAFISNFIG